MPQLTNPDSGCPNLSQLKPQAHELSYAQRDVRAVGTDQTHNILI